MISSELLYAATSVANTAAAASAAKTLKELLPDLTCVFGNVVRMTLAEMKHHSALRACEKEIHQQAGH